MTTTRVREINAGIRYCVDCGARLPYGDKSVQCKACKRRESDRRYEAKRPARSVGEIGAVDQLSAEKLAALGYTCYCPDPDCYVPLRTAEERDCGHEIPLCDMLTGVVLGVHYE